MKTKYFLEKGIVGEMDRNKDNLLSFEDEYDENEQKVIELLSMLSSKNKIFLTKKKTLTKKN